MSVDRSLRQGIMCGLKADLARHCLPAHGYSFEVEQQHSEALESGTEITSAQKLRCVEVTSLVVTGAGLYSDPAA